MPAVALSPSGLPPPPAPTRTPWHREWQEVPTRARPPFVAKGRGDEPKIRAGHPEGAHAVAAPAHCCWPCSPRTPGCVACGGHPGPIETHTPPRRPTRRHRRGDTHRRTPETPTAPPPRPQRSTCGPAASWGRAAGGGRTHFLRAVGALCPMPRSGFGCITERVHHRMLRLFAYLMSRSALSASDENQSSQLMTQYITSQA